MKVKTYTFQVIEYVEAETNAALNRGASALTKFCRAAVARQYPPASSPGEPPARRTGWGQKHIRWTRAIGTKQGARVGIDISEVSPKYRKTAFYMILLELGTRTIAARPWLVATLLARRPEIARAVLSVTNKAEGAT